MVRRMHPPQHATRSLARCARSAVVPVIGRAPLPRLSALIIAHMLEGGCLGGALAAVEHFCTWGRRPVP